MATSGITINQLTRNQFIEAALRTMGVLALDQTPTATEYTNATVKLNALIGELRPLGMGLWARQEYSFPVVAGTFSYTIGVGQTLNTAYPLKLLQAFKTNSVDDSHTPLEIIADYNFNLLPSDSSDSGSPIQLTYQPKINLGIIKLWPTPSTQDVSDGVTINLTYTRPFEYFINSTDTMDLPEEWVSPMIYGLAVRLAPEYSLPLPDRSMLFKEYESVLNNALSAGAEDASFYFQVDRRQ